MRNLLKDMATSLKAEAYYPALITAMVIPDICAALDSNGESTDKKYIKWFDNYAAKHFGTLLSGKTAYFIRCGVVHQGRLSHPAMKRPSRNIMFVTEQRDAAVHLIGVINKDGKEYLVLELSKYCKAIYQSVLEWLGKVEETELYKANYKEYFKKNKLEFFWDEPVSIIAAF